MVGQSTVIRRRLLLVLLLAPLAACAAPTQQMCLEVVLTGTQGGPPAVTGLAGAGTLVRYGSVANQCSDVLMQFDVGRGTTERLSQLGASPNDLDAVFLTHMHSDHTEGLVGLMQLRWHFFGGPVDLICSDDVTVGNRTLSCRAFAEHIGDPFIAAGEIAQRSAESPRRDPAGPAALIRATLVAESQRASVVWASEDVQVSAVTTTHIAGSMAYRVDTPVGSVVVGGDAGNSETVPPRSSSTSETVEVLAAGADILVHSVIHPVFGPGRGSRFPAPTYYRQSGAADLGALARRAGVGQLVFTHMIPALGVTTFGPFDVPGGPLVPRDFEDLAREGGFEGRIHVGGDLLSVRIP